MTKKFDVKALRQKVLSTDDIQYDSIFVEEWDVELPVKTLAAPDLKEIMRYKDDPIRMTILAVLKGCVTEDGERVFEATDLAEFETKKGFGPISKIGTKVLEISGMSANAVKDAKND